jgi:hypothetical protein
VDAQTASGRVPALFTGARRLGTTIAALATCLLLLSGCGDDQVKADNAYVAATDRVVRAFETRFQALQADFTPVSTPRQDLQTLAALKAAVDRVAADLRQVKAPDRIAALHTTLIAKVQAYGPVIAEAQRGFASKDPEAIVAARDRFSKGLDAVAAQVTASITTINAKLR